MFSVRFVTVSVILEANGKPVASQPTTAAAGGGRGLTGWVGTDGETAEKAAGVERPSQQLSPAHFSLSPFDVQRSIPCDPGAQLLWVLHYGHCRNR